MKLETLKSLQKDILSCTFSRKCDFKVSSNVESLPDISLSVANGRVPHTSFTLVVPGVNTMANYEQVLHLIRYKNWHTETLFDRKFKLVCSELNGRYISNDFKVEV